MALRSIIPVNFKVPGTFIKVSLGVGPRSSGAEARQVVLIGNKTDDGTMALLTETDCLSLDDARALTGAGSELFTLTSAVFDANSSATLKLIAIAEAGTAATGTAVFAGTATSGGTIGVSVLGQEVEVGYSAGDTADDVALLASLAVQPDWPVTAAATTATVTFTAKQKGDRGNFIAVRVRVIDGAGITVTPPSGGYLTAGATSDDPEPALDVLGAVRRRYVVAPYSDATQLAKFRAHVDDQEEPLVGHRKWAIFGSLGTLGATTTLTTGLNFPRLQCAWQEGSDQTPGMLAAGLAAKRALEESTDVAHNFDNDVIPGLKPHADRSKIPTANELDSALNNGITPLTSTNSGDVIIVRSITTKSQDQNGLPDFRVLDTQKVTVTDEIGDRCETQYGDRFAGFKADNDPPDDEIPPPGVCTPALCKDLAFEILLGAEDELLLARGSTMQRQNEILFELSTQSPGRFNGVLPIDVVELAHQFAIDVRQVG